MTEGIFFMTEPAFRDTEKQRIQALRDYQILDTLPEADYDNLSYLAKQICNTPVALISLIDMNRQWFKSVQGLQIRETPRDISFCNHAIRRPGEVMIIPDAREDARFSSNPLVTERGVVFYTGAPLVSSQGVAIGTICVIDVKPRTLSEEQVKALRSLAAQVVNLLEWRKENTQLKELTKSLKKSNEELRQAGHAISHDLKQPIFSIEGILRLLKEEVAEKEIQDAEEMIELALTSTTNFQLLLDDLLKYLKEGTLKQKKRKVSLNSAFKRAKSSLREQIKETDAQVITQTKLPTIKGHASELQRLLQNLISNSLKFRDPDVPPKVVLNAREQKNHWLVTVTDNGIGMDPKHSKKVFGVFKRLHSESQYEGTGMGLALCKKILLHHGGKIWLKSRKGEGTTFYMQFPKSAI